MFVRRKKYPSGKTGVIVAEKVNGRMRELKTIGVSNDDDEIELFVIDACEWVEREEARRYPRLDMFGQEREACEREIVPVEEILSRVSNILINGCDLILDRVFDAVGFDKINGAVFRHLVKARLSYPASKAATVE